MQDCEEKEESFRRFRKCEISLNKLTQLMRIDRGGKKVGKTSERTMSIDMLHNDISDVFPPSFTSVFTT